MEELYNIHKDKAVAGLFCVLLTALVSVQFSSKYMLAVFTAGTLGRWHHVCVCMCVCGVCVHVRV